MVPVIFQIAELTHEPQTHLNMPPVCARVFGQVWIVINEVHLANVGLIRRLDKTR